MKTEDIKKALQHHVDNAYLATHKDRQELMDEIAALFSCARCEPPKGWWVGYGGSNVDPGWWCGRSEIRLEYIGPFESCQEAIDKAWELK